MAMMDLLARAEDLSKALKPLWWRRHLRRRWRQQWRRWQEQEQPADIVEALKQGLFGELDPLRSFGVRLDNR